MEKTATLNLRVNPVSKQKAEAVLKQLGIPMSVAMDMYLNQIALVANTHKTVSEKQLEVVNQNLASVHDLLGKFIDTIRNSKDEIKV